MELDTKMNKDLKDSILSKISLSGAADESNAVVNVIITGNVAAIINHSSGLPRIYNHILKKFSLILSQPAPLAALSPFEIRCCLCKRVISYPCWYYNIKYAINSFNYFICFDKSSPNLVNTHCYKRS